MTEQHQRLYNPGYMCYLYIIADDNQDITDIINLYTPEYGENNHNDFPSLNIVLGELNLSKIIIFG